MAKNIFTQSENYNPNYACRVIKIGNIRNHEKADRLEIITVMGYNVITRKSSFQVGDLAIYCPVESAINRNFLKLNNQFEDSELNSDNKEKGFFNKKGRVRAVKLREVPSEGFIFPIHWLYNWQSNLNIKNIEEYLDCDFDTINGELFCQKYVVELSREKSSGSTKSNKRNNMLKRFDRLVENQWKFHTDTEQLQRNIHKLNPDDIVQISSKIHGTSAVIGKVLVNRELTWKEKLAKRFGVKVQDREYGNIYSSRTVIKNRYINKDAGSGFYDVDVWGKANEMLQPHLSDGMIIYCELCGYLPGSSKFIQKGYDYGCSEGDFKIIIYRITLTTPSGYVHEFSTQQVKDWCKKQGLNSVNELYYGKVKDLYPDLDTSEHWHQNLLDRLRNESKWNMEMNDPDCKNKVPFEGIVIRKEVSGIEVFKLKCFAFLGMECKANDNNESNIEDEN